MFFLTQYQALRGALFGDVNLSGLILGQGSHHTYYDRVGLLLNRGCRRW